MNRTHPPLRILSFAACAVLSWQSVVAYAQISHSEEIRVTADELVHIALTNNLDIRISRLQPQVDQFAINGLYGAYEPTFSMSATHVYNSQPGGIFEEGGAVITSPSTVYRSDNYNPGISGLLPTGLTFNLTGPLLDQNVSGFPRTYQANPGITLDQPLLKNFWIDGTRYQIAVAKNTLKTDQQTFRLQVMNVIFNVKAAYYRLTFAQEDLKVQQEGLALKQQTVSDDKQKVQLGSMRPLDERQAESQAATAQSLVQTAVLTLAQQENTVKMLLARNLGQLDNFNLVPAEQLIAVPEHPQQQERWRIGLDQRPEMIQAKVKIQSQHVAIKYDFNQLFPQLDLVGSYGRNATELTFDSTLNTIQQGTHPDYTYGVVLSVPLGNSKARYNYKADRANLQSLFLQAKKQEWSIVTAIDNDIKVIEADLLKVDYTRQARIYAEEALQAGQAELKLGNIVQFQVLQYQDDLTSARSAEISALSDYNTAIEQLALDDGSILERNHIDLQFR